MANELEGPDAEANARLIAAAPDLLEAVKGLLDQIARNGCVRMKAPEGADAAWESAQDAARAALAKAEGRQ